MTKGASFVLLLVYVTSFHVDAAQRTKIVVAAGGIGAGRDESSSYAIESTSSRPPPTGDPATNPAPWNEQHKYVTPTPLPYKPDWSVDEWVEYFKGRHPNFWFKEQLGKKKKKKRRKADDEDTVSYIK